MKWCTATRLLFLFYGFLILPASAHTLNDQHERGNLGIYSQKLSERKAELLGFTNPYGSYVTHVLEESAAAEAGLQPFDYIYGLNGREMTLTRSLTDMLSGYDPGDEVTLQLIRKNQEREISLELGEAVGRGYGHHSEAFLGVRPHRAYEADEMGVRVQIVMGSSAERAGLQTGDLILQMNDIPMVDWNDISTFMDAAKPGDEIEVSLERKGEAVIRTVELGAQGQNDEPEEYAFLGIRSKTVSPEKAEKLGFDNRYGSYTYIVYENTAAERAGLQPFDYVVGIDEYRCGQYQNLTDILRRYQPDDQALLHFIRKGQKQTEEVVFGSRRKVIRPDRDRCEEPFLGVRKSNAHHSDEGVGVDIVSNSTANAMGLQDGDIITAINGYPIIDWDDVGIAVDNTKVGQIIKVTYLRDEQSRTANGAVKSYCDTKQSEARLETRGRFKWEREPEAPVAPGGADWSRFYDELEPQRPDLRDMEVEVEDLAEEEMESLKRDFELDMPRQNTLQVEALRMYPNPNMGMFTLQFTLPDQGDTAIRIYNAFGRMIYNYELGNFSGEFLDEVDISQNGAGSYFLQIRQGQRVLAKKIVLIKN